MVWDPTHPSVGPAGMKLYLHDLRTAFPDFHIDIGEIATCDTNAIWVAYEGVATGLGEYHGHKASHHNSNFSGVSMFRFNDDRSKISEVLGALQTVNLFFLVSVFVILGRLGFLSSDMLRYVLTLFVQYIDPPLRKIKKS